MSGTRPLGSRQMDPSWPLRPVRSTPYRDRLDITVIASGSQTTLFIGKPNGECVGVLEGPALDQLAEQIADRRRRRDGSQSLGVALAVQGRQKRASQRKGPA